LLGRPKKMDAPAWRSATEDTDLPVFLARLSAHQALDARKNIALQSLVKMTNAELLIARREYFSSVGRL